jgi:hypothetical protein
MAPPRVKGTAGGWCSSRRRRCRCFDGDCSNGRVVASGYRAPFRAPDVVVVVFVACTSPIGCTANTLRNTPLVRITSRPC